VHAQQVKEEEVVCAKAVRGLPQLHEDKPEVSLAHV
jgi:hypothetical protein